MTVNPLPDGLQNASDVAFSNPADGEVLTYDVSVDKWRNEAIVGGGGSGELQTSTVVVRPQVGNNGTIQAYCREHGQISSNTNDATVIQAAIDHVSNFEGGTGHTGGRVLIAAHRYDISTAILGRAVTVNGGTNVVYPIAIEGEGGLNGAPAGANYLSEAGTQLRWSLGTAPGSGGAVLNLSNDCHGYKVREIVIDGNDVAPNCARSAGRGVEWWHCRFRRMLPTTSGWGLFVTNGTDATNDRYVQQRVMFCRAEGSGGGRGFYIGATAAGNDCTDGRVFDVQTNGCNDGSVVLDAAGWGFTGGHLTQSATANPGTLFVCNAAFTHITNIYFDKSDATSGYASTALEITNPGVTVGNCFFMTVNRQYTIDAGSNRSVVVHGNQFSGSPAGDYFFRGTHAGQIVMGNSGSAASLNNGVFAPGFTGLGASLNAAVG